MADKSQKTKGNIPGKYYVDLNCIGCGVCVNEAPDNFYLSDDNSYAYVKKQPSASDEEKQAENALSSCSVDAIGNNG